MNAFKHSQLLLEPIKRPGIVVRRLRTILSSMHHNSERVEWLSRLTGDSEINVRKYIREVEKDRPFIRSVRKLLLENTQYFPLPTDFMIDNFGNTLFFHCVSLYVLVRISRPSTVVETGGTPGKSSAFILRAMEQNGLGKLFTVDLHPPVATEAGWKGKLMPKDAYEFLASSSLGSGWIIPSELKSRHEMILGDSKEVLAPLLDRLGAIDIFIHDSDHSYDHMMFEFETAWPSIRPGGFLWSDDINANSAWATFRSSRNVVSTDFTTQGAARKI